MSFLSAQGSDAVFNDTIVHDLTVRGTLNILNDTSGSTFDVPDNVELETITSPDKTNKIDLSHANEIILETQKVNLDNANLTGCNELISEDSTNAIDMSNANEISLHSSTINMYGNVNMKGKTITNFSKLSGTDGVVDVASGYQLRVEGYGHLANCKKQGAYLDWNDGGTGGDSGRTVFINNRGGGTGGFAFYNLDSDSSGNVDSTTTNEIIDVNGTGDMHLYSTTESYSSGEGALIVDGGASVAKSMHLAGKMHITDTTNSTAYNNGALHIDGGLGVAKDVYINGNIHCTGTVSSADIDLYQEFHTYNLGGNSGTAGGTITLNVSQNFTNYMVFPSVYYGFHGSSGTYNAVDTSSAIRPIVISDITKTSFKWSMAKTSGESVDIWLVFWVVFSGELNFPKSY